MCAQKGLHPTKFEPKAKVPMLHNQHLNQDCTELKYNVVQVQSRNFRQVQCLVANCVTFQCDCQHITCWCPKMDGSSDSPKENKLFHKQLSKTSFRILLSTSG
jgi:hypothetical protein